MDEKRESVVVRYLSRRCNIRLVWHKGIFPVRRGVFFPYGKGESLKFKV